MSLLVALVLGVPVAGAVVAVVRPGAVGARAPLVAGILAALGWVVLTAPAQTPELGRLVVTPALAASAAGLALLVAARTPETALARSASLSAVTIFAGAAGVGEGAGSEGYVAAGVGALVVLTAVAALADGARRAPAAGLVVAGAVAAVGALLDDAVVGAVVVVAGVGGAVALAAATSHARLVGASSLPGLAWLVVRALDQLGAADDLDRVGVAGAGAGLVAAAVLAATRRPTPHAAPVAVVAAALVVLSQDLPGARGAGLLLAAGGVLALAAGRPLALVATVPGIAVAFEVFGGATEPVHAAAGLAAVAVLVAAGARLPVATLPRPGIDQWPTAAAIAFAVLPMWGWAGVDLSDHAAGVAVAVACALPVVVVALAPTGAPRPTGRLSARRRRAAQPPHGSTIEDVEREGPADRDLEEVVDVEAAGSAEHPVARPPRAVPLRAPARGGRRRRRIRVRAGRAPR